MVEVAEKRSFASDLLVRLSVAAAWIATVVTVSMLLVVALLILNIPEGNSGWDGYLEFLVLLLALVVVGVSSLIGTICAVIGLSTRYGPSNRTSLRASLAINGIVLLGCVALYVIPAFLVPG